MKEEIKIIAVYNPFKDEYEDLVCKFECHLDKKGKLIGASLASLNSNEGIELLGYLNADNIPAEIEANFVEAYNG